MGVCISTKNVILPTEEVDFGRHLKKNSILSKNIQTFFLALDETNIFSTDLCRFIVSFIYIDVQPQRTLLAGHKMYVSCVALTHDNTVCVSGGYDRVLLVWDVSKGEVIGELKGHKGCVSCCAISKNNELVLSGSRDGCIKLWSLKKLKCKYTFDYKTGYIYCLALTPDQKYIVSGGENKKVTITCLQLGGKRSLKGHTKNVTTVCVTEDQKWIISGSGDATLRKWNFQTGRCVAVIDAHQRNVLCSCLSYDNSFIVSAGRDKMIHLCDLDEPGKFRTLSVQKKFVRCIAITNDNRFVVAGYFDHTVKVWDVITAQQVAIFEGHASNVSCLTITADNRYVIAGDFNCNVRIWDLKHVYDFAAKKTNHVLQTHLEESRSFENIEEFGELGWKPPRSSVDQSESVARTDSSISQASLESLSLSPAYSLKFRNFAELKRPSSEKRNSPNLFETNFQDLQIYE